MKSVRGIERHWTMGLPQPQPEHSAQAKSPNAARKPHLPLAYEWDGLRQTLWSWQQVGNQIVQTLIVYNTESRSFPSKQ